VPILRGIRPWAFQRAVHLLLAAVLIIAIACCGRLGLVGQEILADSPSGGQPWLSLTVTFIPLYFASN